MFPGMGMPTFPPRAYAGALAAPFRPPPFRGPPLGRYCDSSSSSSDCDCDDCRAPPPPRRRRRPALMNDHPFPTYGRDLGPIHRAAQAENIIFSHIRGCYRHGDCEMRQRRILQDTLYQRGINPRNPKLTLRQILRVTRGYDKGAPDPTPSAAELQQAAAPAPAPATAFAPQLPSAAPQAQLPPAPQQAQLPPAPGGAFSQAGSVMGEDQFGGGRRGGHGMGMMGGDGFGGGPPGGMGGRHGGRRNHEQFGGRDGMFLGGGWRGGRGGRQGPPSWVHEDEDGEEEDDGWFMQSRMGRQRY
ncbi:MAG: hypothetical protein LQ337_007098 [Flavoplaca oasis]|nr:MAG: hypothetical protein LQ337_007098 [Flavoplaca oasis]